MPCERLINPESLNSTVRLLSPARWRVRIGKYMYNDDIPPKLVDQRSGESDWLVMGYMAKLTPRAGPSIASMAQAAPQCHSFPLWFLWHMTPQCGLPLIIRCELYER